MKTNNIAFYISLKRVGFNDGYFTCNDIFIIDDFISFFVNGFCIFCIPVKSFDLVFKFDHSTKEYNYHSYDLVKR